MIAESRRVMAISECTQSASGEHVTWRIGGSAVVVGVVLVLLVGCSGSNDESPAGPAAPKSPTSASPTPTMNPEVQKAVDAYLAFAAAANRAQEDPVGKGGKLPEAANFALWSYDPARSQTLVFVHVLDAYNAEYRGDAPESHVQVVEVKLATNPYPIVELSDCRVPRGSYVPYNRKTGKRLRLTGGADLGEPFLADIETIKVQGRWGVRSVDVQQEGTCDPE